MAYLLDSGIVRVHMHFGTNVHCTRAEAMLEADRTPVARMRVMDQAAQKRDRIDHGEGRIAKFDSQFRDYLGALGARAVGSSDATKVDAFRYTGQS